MYKITVTDKKGFILAVHFNSDRELGIWIAKAEHGDKAKIKVESDI